MLGLCSTPSNSPVLTESLDPKDWILLYHYHLYALTGTNVLFHNKSAHKTKEKGKARQKMTLNKKEKCYKSLFLSRGSLLRKSTIIYSQAVVWLDGASR